MIRKIDNKNNIDREFLVRTYYGRKFLAYLGAYDVSYDFCRFFELIYGDIKGYMFQINATLVVCAESEFPCDELEQFILMNQPFRVEAPSFILKNIENIDGYHKLKRTQFEFSEHIPENFNESELEENPKLDEAYDIITEGFPNISNYGLWITENSHRIRRGTSKIYLYKGCTTATVIYDVDNHVLIGQVATRESARGNGYARELLYWLGHKLRSEGKSITLFALDYRESFYREIGFSEISVECVIERKL